jgi:hypothetical protein
MNQHYGMKMENQTSKNTKKPSILNEKSKFNESNVSKSLNLQIHSKKKLAPKTLKNGFVVYPSNKV